MISFTGNQHVTHFRVDQQYSGAASIADAVGAEYFPAETVSSCALCDAGILDAQIAGGKIFLAGDVTGGGDFSIKLKSAVTTETIIPPAGVLVSDIPSTDHVVCYA
jgi:hypothetical protein